MQTQQENPELRITESDQEFADRTWGEGNWVQHYCEPYGMVVTHHKDFHSRA